MLIDTENQSARATTSGTALPSWLARSVQSGDGSDPIGYLARHSRSFRFATRFLPGAEARRIAEIYAFCRFTDDIVDRAETADPAELESRLDQWLALAEAAYAGIGTGIPLLDAPIGGMGRAGIPFAYARALIEGMRMDLRPRPYADMAELETYTYRVAGAVGQWLAERAGISDRRILARAADLGHAMQLTNILRDVGEDLARGRLYLPLDLLARHGLSPADLDNAGAWKGAPPPAYRALMEEMMDRAESRYQSAFRAIPALPGPFQRPVLVAGLVYRGIHDAIRRNGYDNIGRRAHTRPRDKVRIGIKAGRMLASLRELFPARRAMGAPRVSVPVRAGGLAAALGALCLAIVPVLWLSAAPVHGAGAEGAGAARTHGTEAGRAGAARGVAIRSEAAEGRALPQDAAGARAEIEADLEAVEARIRAHPDSAGPRLDRLRLAYVLGVKDEERLPAVEREIEWLTARAGGDRARLDLLRAYRGAVLVAHARHGFNLNRKLRLLKRAAPLLDSAVAGHPDEAEIRYLRLVSGYYLPFFLGRKPMVREDFAALARILPDVTDAFPPEWYLSVAGFVREKGDLPPRDEERLARGMSEALARLDVPGGGSAAE